MSKPTIKRGPASQHASPGEAIVEVYSRGVKAGCLVSLREVDGQLRIEVYQADENVRVLADESLLIHRR